MFDTQKMPKYLNNHGFCEKYISNYFHNLLGLSDFDKNAKKIFQFRSIYFRKLCLVLTKKYKKVFQFCGFFFKKDFVAKAKKRIFFSMLWISYIFAC